MWILEIMQYVVNKYILMRWRLTHQVLMAVLSNSHCKQLLISQAPKYLAGKKVLSVRNNQFLFIQRL